MERIPFAVKFWAIAFALLALGFAGDLYLIHRAHELHGHMGRPPFLDRVPGSD